MDVGVMVEGQDGVSWDQWRTIALAAESLGFGSLWHSDHHVPLHGAPHQHAYDAFVSLTLVALETRRIRFGTLVAGVLFRPPYMLARLAAQLDRISGGRMMLGIGCGWVPAEHEPFGIPLPPLRERFDRLAEALQVLRALWSGVPATFLGKHYQLREALSHPTPVQSPLPILVGGTGEQRTPSIAARYADEWNGPYLTLEGYKAKREVLARHCEAAGRDPASLRHSLLLNCVIGRSDGDLRARMERLLALDHMLLRGRPRSTDEWLATIRRRGWLVGPPQTIVEQLGALEAAGVSRVMLPHLLLDDMEALELLAADVLPHVQRAAL